VSSCCVEDNTEDNTEDSTENNTGGVLSESL